ncbi:helix-turn-helix transcriptional regulator [Ancylobacter sp.]|uniref:helix-turn-helix transcriptional regulator n=1 Tax=Ancylobacter sp. TaxID=1872567 RepID=UPI003BA9CDDD
MQTQSPIRQYRKQHSLSQESLAKQIGVTKTTICRWESGARFPDREFWPRIHEATGLSPNDLLGIGSQQ